MKQKVTFYKLGAFGYSKTEVVEFEVTVKPYAQYEAGVYVAFREPRQRRWRGFVETFEPSLIVLDGWGHPSPDDPLRPTEPGCSITRRASFDPEWATEFGTKIDGYIVKSGAKVLHDFRGHNSHEPVRPVRLVAS